jgi:hypothetical protein
VVPPDATPRGDEPLNELPDPLPEMEAMRGSIFVLDWRWLRDTGRFDAYVAGLGARRDVLDATAAEWVDMGRVLAHYRALDTLGLTHGEAFEAGKTVGPRIHGAVLNTFVRLAGSLGVGPLIVMKQSYKLWTRSFRGGGVATFKTSDRSARVEIRKTEIAESRFLRASFAGVTAASLEPFCKNPLVQERVESRVRNAFGLRISWDP